MPIPTESRRRRPFSLLAKPTGAACNLDCSYCFFLSKEVLWAGSDQRMSHETLLTYLSAYLDSQPDGPVTVAWQGGEPTLRGLGFFREAVRLTEELARPGQRVEHALQTNGTLLDDEWGEFLAEHRVLVGISIDGPEHLHDTYRVNKAARGTHAQVVRGWRVLQRHGVDTNVLCTVNSANADHPLDVYRHFRDELGARFLQFIPIVERVAQGEDEVAEAGWRDSSGEHVLYRQHGEGVTSRSVRPVQWGTFMCTIFDEWLSRDVGEVFVQHVDAALGAMFGRYSLCVHAPECGGALAVEHTGDVYSCDHYVEPEHLLGNVHRDRLVDLVTSPRQRDFGRSKRTALPQQCLDCRVRWACHGGCPKDRFDLTHDGEPGLNHLCEGYRMFFGHTEPHLQVMARLIQRGRPAADVMAGPMPR
ncbi:anaerobic sulfatase maturase [Aestuariimicrobium kwangyangense]|uniref:anaerobic sulfatase maturase n=1 Tax=Aestuariimicrobium kwangyangense TaxID=396389 RepID=UPI0003B47B57|nr:anaerobic sulfatase maturase [Aestuariimicrobium kwangyangense]